MRTMRHFAWTAILLVPLHLLPAGAVEAPRQALPPASPSNEIRSDVPPVQYAALGMLAPGTPQFLLGEPLKASAYLGGTAALGVGAYLLLRQIFYADSFQPGAFFPEESNALLMLNAAGIAWLTGGALSTLDAYMNLQAKQPPLQPPAAPGPLPTPSPATRPTPAPLATPAIAPTPFSTPAPWPTPPVATPTPRPSATPLPGTIPTPAPTPDPETAVYRAYDLAAKGQYLEAVAAVQAIQDPDWLPKAKALLAEWAPKAVEDGLSLARTRLAEGDPKAARMLLDRLSTLPRTEAQTRAMNALLQRLR